MAFLFQRRDDADGTECTHLAERLSDPDRTRPAGPGRNPCSGGTCLPDRQRQRRAGRVHPAAAGPDSRQRRACRPAGRSLQVLPAARGDPPGSQRPPVLPQRYSRRSGRRRGRRPGRIRRVNLPARHPLPQHSDDFAGADRFQHRRQDRD